LKLLKGDVVAAAIELRDDLLLVPVCSRSPRVD